MEHVFAAQAVDVLMAEHRQIERVLRVLHDLAVHVVKTFTAPKPETIGAIARFAETFADGRHHEKEEKVLFAEMYEQGFSRSTGPVPCMVRQHETGRGLVAVLRKWSEADAERRQLQLNGMLQAAFDYVQLLSSHISVEDSVLFPAALVNLPNDALVKVAAAYRRIDPATWREEIVAAADDVVRLAQAEWEGEKRGSST